MVGFGFSQTMILDRQFQKFDSQDRNMQCYYVSHPAGDCKLYLLIRAQICKQCVKQTIFHQSRQQSIMCLSCAAHTLLEMQSAVHWCASDYHLRSGPVSRRRDVQANYRYFRTLLGQALTPCLHDQACLSQCVSKLHMLYTLDVWPRLLAHILYAFNAHRFPCTELQFALGDSMYSMCTVYCTVCTIMYNMQSMYCSVRTVCTLYLVPGTWYLVCIQMQPCAPLFIHMYPPHIRIHPYAPVRLHHQASK